ncbi:MAG: TIGR03985 family CRISPR-associated protein [Cyanobacteria bacterium SID2]|nr:TIGR03985 family CRISPR-associated protein [Cyanobacteria bacterium SID2]MBP0004074.1 TIGR03985 family CRISPR-associated protein [Cyanobacteria bacterium SBC]
MSELTFQFPPHPSLLQGLTRGALAQHLLRSIRLWVELSWLYSPQSASLPNGFTYAQWRDAFFHHTHPKGEAIPPLHDRACACAKTAADWLQPWLNEDWQQILCRQAGLDDKQVSVALQRRLFGVTRRSMADDFRLLVELGWLQRCGRTFDRVSVFPVVDIRAEAEAEIQAERDDTPLAFVNLDLGTLAQQFATPIAGVQRFFFEVDYIVRDRNIDRVEDWQVQLQQLWSRTVIPPVRLHYNSAKLGASVRCVVYPVCCYYVRRAIYLCGFGQTPSGDGQWYNFRLDRVRDLQSIEWDDESVPLFLQQAYRKKNLPTPQDIRQQMEAAWGFDFYLKTAVMVLRFDRAFHDSYVAGTFRHETFEPVSYTEVGKLVRHCAEPPYRERLLAVLQARSSEDAYYRSIVRQGDTNVRMRLRAWRPFGEVLLPWGMRQEMATEVKQEYDLYDL